VWTNGFADVKHFEDGTTLGLLDSTANNNDGTLVAAGDGFTMPTAGTGTMGGGVTVANASRVRAGNAAVTALPLTISGWVKPTAVSTTQAVASLADPTIDDQYFTLLLLGDKAYLDCQQPSVGYALVSGSTTLSPGAWVYLAAVYTSGTARELFLNGVSEGTGTDACAPSPTVCTRFTAGLHDKLNTLFPLDGLLDEVRLANAARSASWLLAEYNNQSSPSTFYAVGGAEAVGDDGPVPGGPSWATIRWYRRNCLLMVD
jgi:hypothetical protein